MAKRLSSMSTDTDSECQSRRCGSPGQHDEHNAPPTRTERQTMAAPPSRPTTGPGYRDESASRPGKKSAAVMGSTYCRSMGGGSGTELCARVANALQQDPNWARCIDCRESLHVEVKEDTASGNAHRLPDLIVRLWCPSCCPTATPPAAPQPHSLRRSCARPPRKSATPPATRPRAGGDHQ